MWILGSTLSISQRSLLPEIPPSPLQQRAQELAHQLIQSYASRPAISAAVDFIKGISPAAEITNGQLLRVAAPSGLLDGLGLPVGYGVKGGAAREALSAALGIRAPRPPRDIDVVRRGTHRIAEDEAVARRLMPRDFQHGARVEVIRDLEGYISTRDLTINEVVATDGTVAASVTCALDSIGQVLRPSRYRGGTLHRKPGLFGQSILKMVRLYAEGSCAGESWTIAGIPEEASFSDFDLAVHLNKAFQRGKPVAERFLHACSLLSLLAACDDPVQATLRDLEHLRHGERSLLPDVPAEEWHRALQG